VERKGSEATGETALCVERTDVELPGNRPGKQWTGPVSESRSGREEGDGQEEEKRKQERKTVVGYLAEVGRGEVPRSNGSPGKKDFVQIRKRTARDEENHEDQTKGVNYLTCTTRMRGMAIPELDLGQRRNFVGFPD